MEKFTRQGTTILVAWGQRGCGGKGFTIRQNTVEESLPVVFLVREGRDDEGSLYSAKKVFPPQ